MSHDGEQSEAPKAKPNPFGAARPREQVIAERLGKKETEVLQEQAQKDWKPKMALTDAQVEEKKAAEAEVAYARSDLEKESDPEKTKDLQEILAAKQGKLDELLLSFEKASVRPAPRRERREQHGGGENQAEYGSFNRGPPRGGREGDSRQGYPEAQDFQSFNRSRGRDSDWKGRNSQSQCYTCGEIGHFARECPNNSRGGGFAYGNRGGGKCYNCNEEGHIARECPRSQAGGFGGPRGGGGGGGGGYYSGGGYNNEYHQHQESGYGYGGGR